MTQEGRRRGRWEEGIREEGREEGCYKGCCQREWQARREEARGEGGRRGGQIRMEGHISYVEKKCAHKECSQSSKLNVPIINFEATCQSRFYVIARIYQ